LVLQQIIKKKKRARTMARMKAKGSKVATNHFRVINDKEEDDNQR
jgi:hypothetical protein